MTKNITEGKTFSTLFKFTLPLVVSSLISSTYSIVDFIIAGVIIGSDALSMVGASASLINFISAFYYGVSISIQVRCGSLYGAKEYKKLTVSFKSTLYATMFIMLVVGLLTTIFATPLMHLLKVDPLIFDGTKLYFIIIMLLTPLSVFNLLVSRLIQSIGESKIILVASTLSGLLNVVLNIIFTAVFHMGVLGLALATVISVISAIPLYLYKMAKIYKELGGNMKPEIDFKELKNVYVYSVPSSLQQATLYLAEVFTQPFVNTIGKAATAGYSIALRVHQILNSTLHGVSYANASYTSQVYGTKEYEKFSKGLFTSFLIQIIIIVIPSLLLVLFPNEIMGVFLKDNDTSVLEYAIPYIKYTLPFILFFAFSSLTHSFFRSCYAANLVIVQTVIGAASRILFILILPETNDLLNIYLSLSFSWVMEALFALIIYLTKAYYTKEVKENIKLQKNEVQNGL